MKIAKASGTLGLAALTVIASPFAVAIDPGWYGGVNVGQSRAKLDEARITSNVLGGGFATTWINEDNRDTGYKLFGGYKVNRNFALEGGYFNLGKFGFTAATAPAGTLSGNIKVQGLNLDLVGILPFTAKFSAFARVGLNYAEAKDSFSGTGSVRVLNANPNRRGTNAKLGLGVQYDFTDRLGMRVEAERYRIKDGVGNKGDIDVFSVGLVYQFGKKTSAPAPRPAAVTPPPEPRAVTPPPPPRAVTPPPPPQAVTPPPPPRAVTPPPPQQAPARRDRN